MRLIDADNLLNALDSMTEQPRCTEDVAYNRAVHNVEKLVTSMPSIDPVKHGHWIDVELIRSFGKLNGIQCSECGKQQVKGPFGVPKYCCECGAKMDSEARK